jgi:hypothetical protein
LWTERDKTQLRGVCTRKTENNGYVTTSADTSIVFLRFEMSYGFAEHIKVFNARHLDVFLIIIIIIYDI